MLNRHQGVECGSRALVSRVAEQTTAFSTRISKELSGTVGIDVIYVFKARSVSTLESTVLLGQVDEQTSWHAAGAPRQAGQLPTAQFVEYWRNIVGDGPVTVNLSCHVNAKPVDYVLSLEAPEPVSAGEHSHQLAGEAEEVDCDGEATVFIATKTRLPHTHRFVNAMNEAVISVTPQQVPSERDCRWSIRRSKTDARFKNFAESQLVKYSLALLAYDIYQEARRLHWEAPDDPEKLQTFRFMNYILGISAYWEIAAASAPARILDDGVVRFFAPSVVVDRRRSF
jgi:hypothetical protein